MANLHGLIVSLIEKHSDDLTLDILISYKRSFARDQKLATIPSNMQLLRSYHHLIQNGAIAPSPRLEKLIQKRPIRSQSGIVSVQVLTKPYRCPGKCIFCPNDFTMPKSYINTEPGAMRALLNNFDPIKQVYNRLLSLTLTGHKTDKIEMIVLGGTRDVYPDEYKEGFVKWLYDACNSFDEFFSTVSLNQDHSRALKYSIDDSTINYPLSLEESLHINESAWHRIIGLTVETRPEYVTDANCRFWRKLGVTRLEIGIQSSNDDVLAANKRWHDYACSKSAIHKLRQYGFKMSVHLMPGLYQSDYHKDLQTFIDVYQDPEIKPDEIKFYPTSVIPNTELYDLYESGDYKPLETSIIKALIRECFLHIIPPYTRIKRLIRDIPSTEIVAGSSVTNLSQLTHQDLKKQLKGSKELHDLYARLYENLSVYHTLNDYLNNDRTGDQVVNGISTAVIWVMPDMDSYRNFVSLDTRSREIRQKYEIQSWLPKPDRTDDTLINLVIRTYVSSVWQEFFISYEDRLGYLFAFTRLMLPDREHAIDWEWLGSSYAQIRELHVYGNVESIGGDIDNTNTSHRVTQHVGFGKQLMDVAENIARRAGYHYLSVIAGVGVRAYYRKIGYELQGSYMVKDLCPTSR